MTAETYPLRVLLLSFAGWINVQQQHVVEYLVEENRVLKEQLGGKRVRSVTVTLVGACVEPRADQEAECRSQGYAS